MNKKIFIVIVLIAVLFFTAFASVSNAGADENIKLVPDVGYTLEELTLMAPELQDLACGREGFPLCETLGHFGFMSLDIYGIPRIPGLFLAPDGLWYVTDPDTVFRLAGSTCYPYEIVAWPTSGACELDSVNPLCQSYIARPGYVYNWYSEGKWPVGVQPQVSGYYPAGLLESPLYCKIQN